MDAPANSEPRVRVGTSGWKKPAWRGHFYPSGLPQVRELRYAAERMPTLEVNPDHQGIRSPFDAIRLQKRVGGSSAGPGVTVQPPLWGD